MRRTDNQGSMSASMSVDPLSMKSVLDRVELLEKSYQEERLAVRLRLANAPLRTESRQATRAAPDLTALPLFRAQRMMIEGEITKERSEVRGRAKPLPHSVWTQERMLARPV